MHLDGMVGPSNMHSYALSSGNFLVGLRSISSLENDAVSLGMNIMKIYHRFVGLIRVGSKADLISGWWFANVCNMNFMTFHILGMSSQLTFTHIFFRGVGHTTSRMMFHGRCWTLVTNELLGLVLGFISFWSKHCLWSKSQHMWLVGGDWNMFYCPFYIWDVILPIDSLTFIFFGGVETTNQVVMF